MNTPTLSIVMPVFNHLEMLEEMVASILANDYQDWELIAVDDGSTTDVKAYLSRLSDKDLRIRFIERDREPKGAQTCRNIGLQLAQGKYVAFFDSDDYVAPHCLRSRVEAIEQRPSADFVVFPSGTYCEKTFFPAATDNVYGLNIYADDLASFLERQLPFIVWNNIYLTSSLRKHQLWWDTKLLSLQDSDYNIQALLHGLRYEYAPQAPDYGYRITTSNSVSKKMHSEEHRNSHLYFLRKQYEQVQQRYGKRYNHSLFLGVLYLYSITMADGFDAAYARQLVAMVAQYDALRGFKLRCQVTLSSLLAKVLPKKVARQAVMPFYLIRKRWQIKSLPRRISSYRQYVGR